MTSFVHPPIRLGNQSRVIWICGASLEIEYLEGHERLHRTPQQVQRVMDVVQPVSQMLWAR